VVNEPCDAKRHGTRLDSAIDGERGIGLDRARMPGNLVAIDVPERGREWTVLGRWWERPA